MLCRECLSIENKSSVVLCSDVSSLEILLKGSYIYIEKMAEIMQQIQMEAVDSKVPMISTLDITSREWTSEPEIEDTR